MDNKLFRCCLVVGAMNSSVACKRLDPSEEVGRYATTVFPSHISFNLFSYVSFIRVACSGLNVKPTRVV